MTTTEEILLKLTAVDGATQVVREITEAAKRYGATLDEQKQIVKSLDAEAQKHGVSLAKVKEAYKGLAAETEDAVEATKHLDVTLRHQLATGINSTAAAARDIGDVLGGGTRALRQYDAQAIRTADAIDKIKDPALRARLAMAELERAVGRQNSTLGRAEQRWHTLHARLTATGPLGQVASTAISNVGTALVSLAAGALASAIAAAKKYNDTTTAGKIGNEQLAQSLEHLTLSYGKAAEGTLQLGDKQTKLAALTEGLARTVDSLSATWTAFEKATPAWLDAIGEVAWGIAKVSNPIGLVITQAELAYEALSKLVGADSVYQEFLDMQHRGAPKPDAAAKQFAAALDAQEAAIIKQAEAERAARAQQGAETDRFLEGLSRKRQARQAAAAAAAAKKRGRGGKSATASDTGEGFRSDFFQIARDVQAEEDAAILRRQRFVRAQEDLLLQTQALVEASRQYTAGDAERDAARTMELERERAAVERLREAYYDLGAGVSSSMLQISGALADHSLKLSELGGAAADSASELLVALGSKVGNFAALFGGVMALLGESFSALASNPFALAGIGLALVGAGLALKHFAGSAAAKTPKSAARSSSSGDSRTASSLERLGRQIVGDAPERESRSVVLMVDGYEMASYVRDRQTDDARRGRVRRR